MITTDLLCHYILYFVSGRMKIHMTPCSDFISILNCNTHSLLFLNFLIMLFDDDVNKVWIFISLKER